MSSTTLIYVLNYPAMGINRKPKRLHRTDCTHSPNPIWRPATPQELKTVAPCKSCIERD